MAKSNVDALRAEYRRVRKNVGSKIARIEKTVGKVAGSSYDPRKAVGHEKKLNSAQLKSAIAKMQAFQSRSNSFVKSASGAISKADFARYKSKQNLLVTKSRKFTEGIANNTFPGMESTARQLQSQYHQRADGHENSPFNIVALEAESIRGVGALKRLEAKVDKQLKPEFFEKHMELSRRQMTNALIRQGEPENADLVGQLSDFQFAMLWYGTTAPESVFVKGSGSDTADIDEDSPVVEDSEIRGYLLTALNEVPREGRIV